MRVSAGGGGESSASQYPHSAPVGAFFRLNLEELRGTRCRWRIIDLPSCSIPAGFRCPARITHASSRGKKARARVPSRARAGCATTINVFISQVTISADSRANKQARNSNNKSRPDRLALVELRQLSRACERARKPEFAGRRRRLAFSQNSLQPIVARLKPAIKSSSGACQVGCRSRQLSALRAMIVAYTSINHAAGRLNDWLAAIE